MTVNAPAQTTPRVVEAHVVCKNGTLIPAEEAQISIFHPVFSHAFGIYESIEVANDLAFHAENHLARLAQSAKILDLPLPASTLEIATWISPLLAASAQRTCIVRLLVLGHNHESDAFLWAQERPVYPPEFYTNGVGAVTFEAERAIPQAKSLNTLVNFLARRKAKEHNEHEGLLVSEGTFKEGSSSNLFVVKRGLLHVPPPNEVLAGVTADLVLALAKERGIGVAVGPLPVAEIGTWDEAFLTSTSRHVMPLVRVDGTRIGNGAPGSVTLQLHNAFEDAFHAYFATRRTS